METRQFKKTKKQKTCQRKYVFYAGMTWLSRGFDEGTSHKTASEGLFLFAFTGHMTRCMYVWM